MFTLSTTLVAVVTTVDRADKESHDVSNTDRMSQNSCCSDVVSTDV